MDPLRSVVTVELRRSTQSKWMMRVGWAMYLLLVASALLSATQEPVFIVFAAFVAVVGGVVMWGNRERAEDHDRLRAFVVRMFPESIGTRFEL